MYCYCSLRYSRNFFFSLNVGRCPGFCSQKLWILFSRLGKNASQAYLIKSSSLWAAAPKGMRKNQNRQRNMCSASQKFYHKLEESKEEMMAQKRKRIVEVYHHFCLRSVYYNPQPDVFRICSLYVIERSYKFLVAKIIANVLFLMLLLLL